MAGLMQRVFMNLTHTVGKNESACFRSRSARSMQPSGKAPTAPGSAENILTIIPCLPYNET